MKNYLESELARNHTNKHLYERLLKIAVAGCSVEVGHHVTIHLGDEDGNEIPSADAVLFDHDIMQKVFGHSYMSVMLTLASTPTDKRDSVLAAIMDNLEVKV